MDPLTAVKSAQHKALMTGIAHVVTVLPDGQIVVLPDGRLYGGATVAERCLPDENLTVRREKP